MLFHLIAQPVIALKQNLRPWLSLTGSRQKRGESFHAVRMELGIALCPVHSTAQQPGCDIAAPEIVGMRELQCFLGHRNTVLWRAAYSQCSLLLLPATLKARPMYD